MRLGLPRDGKGTLCGKSVVLCFFVVTFADACDGKSTTGLSCLS
jgi:hypothetical protein